MKLAISAALLALGLSSCVTHPYYGKSVIKEDGNLICGLHRVPVKVHEGYIYLGHITFVDQESMNFASDRFPNTLNATFSEEKSEDYSLSFTDYTCGECEDGYQKLNRIPMWYKRIAGLPAKVSRELQLERAAAKAARTGDPSDARIRDGDGYLSRIR